MVDYISTSPDGWAVLKVVAMLVPVLVFIWIIMTVMALHKRDVYFWGLGSTWSSIVACPVALLIMSLGPWSHAPIIAGAILYAGSFAFAIFYNYNAAKSAMLALSTSILQQLAVVGVIFLFFRWHANEVNRSR
jgi:hypothetical protein